MLLEGMQLGRYRLRQLIGRGGMGEVYLADDTHMPRQVAVKIVQTESVGYPDKKATEEATRLFEREMRVIITLDHPYILQLFDYGEAIIHNTTLTYMVMPLLKEGSLNDWLQKRGTSELLSVQDVAYIIQQAADALQHAHDQHIVHQDIKPSNFLIRTRKDRPERPDLLLTDFGIAKFTSATATASQTVRGTPTYMAPEQWEGRPVAATDQYALAVMAYLLLTGQAPFQGGQGQVMRQHFTITPQPPSMLNFQLFPAVDAVLLRALAKRPEDRFPSISAFAQAFQQAAQQSREPLPPPPPPLPPNYAPISFNNTDYGPSGSGIPYGPGASGTVPAAPYGFPPPPAPPVAPVQPRRTLSRVMVIALVALALLILVSSGIIYSVSKTATDNANATNTAITLSNNNATATVQATANAGTATAAAQTHATATAQAIATATGVAQANATASVVAANPDPYPPTNGKLVVYDPLSTITNSQWFNYTDSSFGGHCGFTGGTYHLSQTQTHRFYECASTSTFRNFAFEVQMRIISGDCGGLIFRSNSKGQLYLLSICQSGSYQFYMYPDFSGNNIKTLTDGSAPAIHTGLNQLNTVAVVANGSQLDLYVNNQRIDSINDSTYSQGTIGMIANSISASTEVSYSNLKVWAL
jgi:eukaryotic-like serine/threonine-protein kinase